MFETLTQGRPSTWPSRVTAARVAAVTSSSPIPSLAIRSFRTRTRPSAANLRSITSSVQTRSKGGSSSVNECSISSNIFSIEPTPTRSQASSVAIPVCSEKRRKAAGRFWNGHQSS